ncbi:aminotransferase class III-fold pyridoxal phosphate-dependent enzyme [Zavarzinia aquatilis]|uniref:Aspartate aminotransferase family protein n=1 Tax=Zavarzinia aquatilis TaxID=2211142 RepID=A0A317EDV7_9PROT|nr:aminotransferase class III-fold pyridoxal phosphate-dependent enzyme [Zavarzinia aquatilis]PWR25218.1 aspartate aminotransferase family protein [Zavarzinia aquatilis]
MKRLLRTGLNVESGDAPQIVGGEGVYFTFSDGRRLIDGSSTGGPLGHRHPDMLEALRKTLEIAPVISEGWDWREREAAAEELIDLAFAGEHGWVGAVRFFLSGSEANDQALSLAQAITGRTPLATRERAYHGLTGLSRAVTTQPQWHGGLSRLSGGIRPAPIPFDVRRLPAPEGARAGRGADLRPAASLLADAGDRLAGCAALILDYTQGGIYHDADYQDRAAAAARAAGALWIADEVVTGLGRSGRWFAFQGGDSRPDMVTLGKPLAGGAMPCGAVVLSKDMMAELAGCTWQSYSTFRAHPLMIAATRAYLRVLVRDGLLDRVRVLEARIAARMATLAARHPAITRIDGRGLHWTIELEGPDWRQWRGDSADIPVATRVSDRAAEAGALIGTSGEQTSLFLAPALIVSDAELDRLFDALDFGLEATR